MSETAPNRPAYDMKRFRRAIRTSWSAMQFQYRVGVRKFWIVGDWPQIADYEIKATRQRRDDL